MSKQKQKNRKVDKEPKSNKQHYLRANQNLIKLPSHVNRTGTFWPLLDEVNYKSSWNNINYFSMSTAIMMTQLQYFYMWFIYDYYSDLLEEELVSLSKQVGNTDSPKSFEYISNIDLFKYNITNNTKESFKRLLYPNQIKDEVFEVWELIRLLSKLMFVHVLPFESNSNKVNFMSNANDKVIYNSLSEIKDYCDNYYNYDDPNVLLSMYYYTLKQYLTKTNDYTKFKRIECKCSHILSNLYKHLNTDEIDINDLILDIRSKVNKLAIPSMQWFTIMENTDGKNKYHGFHKKYFKLVLDESRRNSTYNFKLDIDFNTIKNKIVNFNTEKKYTYDDTITEILDKFLVNPTDIDYTNRDRLVKPFFDEFYKKLKEY